MNALKKIVWVTGVFAAVSAAFMAGVVPFLHLGGVFAEADGLNMATLLDVLLNPTAITQITPRSQWNNLVVKTSDANAAPPPINIPAFSEVTQNTQPQEPAGGIFYVANTESSLPGAFGTAGGYKYWVRTTGKEAGPFAAPPAEIHFDFSGFVNSAPLNDLDLVVVHALAASWIYADRIYYHVSSHDQMPLNGVSVFVSRTGDDADGNAVPDNLQATLGPNQAWTAETGVRNVLAANVGVSDLVRQPGQSLDTFRLAPGEGLTLDVPNKASLVSAGLAGPPDNVLAVVQVANTFPDLVDDHAGGVWAAKPGELLDDAPYMALHYLKGGDNLQPVMDISPRSTRAAMRVAPGIPVIVPTERRLSVWHHPLDLSPANGRYVLPAEGRWQLALAQNVQLEGDLFSADIRQGGILLPLVVELWAGDAVPTVLPAGSNRQIPLTLSGVFPTWMAASPDAGVTVAEARTRYGATLQSALTFRTAMAVYDGITAAYAIAPVPADPQLTQRMHLWAPANLTADPNAAITISYTNRGGTRVDSRATVQILPTALVITSVLPEGQSPGTVRLSPEQGSVATIVGAYPLESGRYFRDDRVTATTQANPGWGFRRWLRDGVEVSTDAAYTFTTEETGDTVLAAEFASYALNVNLLPDSSYGTVVQAPEPVAGIPGYAPGTAVSLHAQPAAGKHFVGWSGPDADDLVVDPLQPARASMVMDGDKTINARFRSEGRYVLNLLDSPGGAVQVEQAGAVVNPNVVEFDPGTRLTLTAMPDAGHEFLAWVGANAADLIYDPLNPVVAELVMDSDKTLGAVFRSVLDDAVLQVTLQPADGGIVTSNPIPRESFVWEGRQYMVFAVNAAITLTASPNAGFRFYGWTETVSGTESDIPLIMSADRNVTASFQRIRVLIIQPSRPPEGGWVDVSADREPLPSIPYADGTRTLTYDYDGPDDYPVITLSAVPFDPFEFRRWVGNVPPGQSTSPVITFTLNVNRTIAAEFARMVRVTIEQPELGEITWSPAPERTDFDTEELSVLLYRQGTRLTLTAEPDAPADHVLNAWRIDGAPLAGDSLGFGQQLTRTLNADVTFGAEFARRVRLDALDLAFVPQNRPVPLAITGVFPVWMGASPEEGLTQEEAESRYEVLIGDARASFVSPYPGGPPYIPKGSGIAPMDEDDLGAANTAYVWSPSLINVPADALGRVPVQIRDRRNPLNNAEAPEQVDVRALVVLTTQILPLDVRAAVLTDPRRAVIPGRDEETEGLELEVGRYVLGDVVQLNAIPRETFFRYRIIAGANVQEATEPDIELTLTADTTVVALFLAGAFQLTLTPSPGGAIVADPPASPGLAPGWYAPDTEVTLTAVPQAELGYRFASWTNDLIGSRENPATITMDGDRRVGALFLPPTQVSLTVVPSAHGHVVLNPAGTTSPDRPGVHLYARNVPVQLYARANTGYRFDRWRVMTADGEHFEYDLLWTVVLARDLVVEPLFTKVYRLNVSHDPENGGSVTLKPPQPAAGYDVGTVVTLTARPSTARGFRFVQWDGRNAAELEPGPAFDVVTLAMDGDKEVLARFRRLAITAVEPAEAWIFGGVVARISGTAMSPATRVAFGDVEVPVFDVSQYGNFAYVVVPPSADTGTADFVSVRLELRDGDAHAAYQPGFAYRRRTLRGGIYTAAFIAEAGRSASVLLGRAENQEIRVAVPPLGQTPAYGLVRAAAPGRLAVASGDVPLPGAPVPGLYDVALHLYVPRSDPNYHPQYGVMVYEDKTAELLAFARPFNLEAVAVPGSTPGRTTSPAIAADAPTVDQVRQGISLWGVPTAYDYVTNTEQALPISADGPYYQSMLLGNEVMPAESRTTPSTSRPTGIAGARIYGAMDAARQANGFTWRQNATLTDREQAPIAVTAVDGEPVSGSASGPVTGGTVLTLTSPYGGLAWIHSIELVGANGNAGGRVLARDFVTKQGENEFQITFRVPRSSRRGTVDIVIRPAANPEVAYVVEKAFVYTRGPISWWIILLLVIGLALAVVGIATAD